MNTMTANPTEAYLERIHELLPQLSVETARLNRDGLANDVLLINGELVFRFPKTDHSRADLQRELALLRKVRRHVALPVPVVELVAPDVVMYRRIPGEPLYRHKLLRAPERDQAAIAEQLGEFLSQLGAAPLEGEQPQRDRHERYVAILGEAERLLFPLLWADQRAYIEDLFAPVLRGDLELDDFPAAFVHRDLASYHILYDPETARLTGVIDFGTAGAGDAAIDYACLISTYGESLLKQMHQSAPIAQELLDRARFLMGALELEWAVQGVRDNDPSWLLVHLGRARDARPFLSKLM
jgi:aminoglycoside 2''-phosphotransferase